MTREEYAAPARQRRAQAQEMRANGISVRDIARALTVSVREVYRLLESVVMALVRHTGGSVAPAVQGSPGLSDFDGADALRSSSSFGPSRDEGSCIDPVVNGEASVATPSAAHGGAIAAAIVSEYAASARRAQHESGVACDKGNSDLASFFGIIMKDGQRADIVRERVV